MKIQLKRSNVLSGGSAKEPTAAQMEYGELAVNYNEADPAILLKIVITISFELLVLTSATMT